MKHAFTFLVLVSLAPQAQAARWQCALRNPTLFGLAAQNVQDADRFVFEMADQDGALRERVFQDKREQVQVKVSAQDTGAPRLFVDVFAAQSDGKMGRVSSANGPEVNAYATTAPGRVGVECDLLPAAPAVTRAPENRGFDEDARVQALTY